MKQFNTFTMVYVTSHQLKGLLFADKNRGELHGQIDPIRIHHRELFENSGYMNPLLVSFIGKSQHELLRTSRLTTRLTFWAAMKNSHQRRHAYAFKTPCNASTHQDRHSVQDSLSCLGLVRINDAFQ